MSQNSKHIHVCFRWKVSLAYTLSHQINKNIIWCKVFETFYLLIFFVLSCDRSRKNISWWAYFLGFFKWMWLLMDSKLRLFFWLFQIKIFLVVNFSFFNNFFGKHVLFVEMFKMVKSRYCFNISFNYYCLNHLCVNCIW
jgi:hypothetical protein